jgi:hypothetical protein
MSHDRNFKILITDYSSESICLFAPVEAADPVQRVRIIPIREEQLKDRPGDLFCALDTPLLLEWSVRRREALLFVLGEVTDPSKFSTSMGRHRDI